MMTGRTDVVREAGSGMLSISVPALGSMSGSRKVLMKGRNKPLGRSDKTCSRTLPSSQI